MNQQIYCIFNLDNFRGLFKVSEHIQGTPGKPKFRNCCPGNRNIYFQLRSR